MGAAEEGTMGREARILGLNGMPYGLRNKLGSEKHGVQMQIQADRERRLVRMTLPEPVDWMAFTPENARTVAKALILSANEIDPPSGT